ncbi:MAG: hypothetical protein PVH29_04370 [Candidatus Zixiibacteriota bacterium]|jgi:hypothetical protein
MKLPSGKTILIYAAVLGFMAVMFGIIIGVRKIVAAGALTTPPELKPWVYGCGLATMWGTVGVSQLARRLGVFQDESNLRQAMRVIVNLAGVAAVAAGFFTAFFNLPGEGNVMLRMTLLMATTASGALTFRLAVF